MRFVHGTTKIRGHCTFNWHERQIDARRVVEVEPEHCESCVAELRRTSRAEIQLPRSWPRGTLPPLEGVRADLEILVIDDDDEGRAVTAQVLEEKGYRVRTAAQGLEGLAILSEMRGATLILLDLAMPVMNGHEVLRELRVDARFSSVPVIVLSGERIYSKPTGCDLLLPKPVAPTTLLAAVGLYGARARRPSFP